MKLEEELKKIENNVLTKQQIEKFLRLPQGKRDYRHFFSCLDLTEECKLWAVRQYGLLIQYIPNPTEEMKLIAVSRNGGALQYIDNPSEEVQLAAVKQYGKIIQLIDTPSEEVQLAAVNQNGRAIFYIKNPSKKIIELARSKGTIYENSRVAKRNN
jgi:hypothetical protein